MVVKCGRQWIGMDLDPTLGSKECLVLSIALTFDGILEVVNLFIFFALRCMKARINLDTWLIFRSKEIATQFLALLFSLRTTRRFLQMLS